MFSVIVLAIIQGIAEFLPISSSAHLIIFRDVFGIGKDFINTDLTFIFDIALHFGTMLAILVFFFKDFWNMFIKGFTKGVNDKDGKLLWYIVAATIPAAVCGLLFEDVIQDVFRTKYWLIALALIIMGILIYFADKNRPNKKKLDKITLKDAICIGVGQVFAMIPGFSRSGTTIAVARMLDIDREDSAKFSFYLSAPVVFGAVVLQIFKTDLSLILENIGMFALGTFVAFISGIICIKFLLRYLKKNDFKIFMWYRVILGIIVLITLLF